MTQPTQADNRIARRAKQRGNALALTSLVALAVACGEDKDPSGRSESGTGGTDNASGGSTASGGSSEETGGSSSGGNPSTGASDGSGGDTTGGNNGSGGGDGVGGTPATGGLPNFDIDFSCEETGAAGSAGFGGEGGAEGAGNEVSLMPTSANWFAACSIDLLGAYYTVADEGGSTITPNCENGATEGCFTGPDLCAAGTATRVLNGNYGHYWGTTLGIVLCDEQTGACPAPPEFNPVVDDWQPYSYGLTELEFNVTGSAPNVRLTIQTIDGAQYCRTINSAESIPLSTLTEECWILDGTPYAGQPITHIMWQIPTNELEATYFDFCVEDVRLK